MRQKLSFKVLMSFALSAILFCMPVGAFLMNSGNVVSVFASDDGQTEEQTTESAAEESTENSTEESTEDETVSGNDTKPFVCTCEDKCSQYDVNGECEVCKADYSQCAYVIPDVKVTIKTPSGWHNDTTKVHVTVEDIAESGNFTIKSVEAKIAQNGSWTDITEDMYIEISENSTIYVRVTDQKGTSYEKNRYIKCFDFTKPTLNAAVSDGLLSVQAHDADSGVKTIYVNGYEFTDITNGALNIRLQQFDAGYQYFTIQAMDHAGNLSDTYRSSNPYYTDSEKEDSTSTENPEEQLPVSAEATKPSSATAQVTEHTQTDSNGNTVSNASAGSGADESNTNGDGTAEEDAASETGKEFYTIQTASEKVFYLIIDRDGEEEMVHFLTEISENDLLNTTTDTNSETIPKNSAALESAIPTEDGALANNNTGESEKGDVTKEDTVSEEGTEENTEVLEETTKTEESPMTMYLVMGIVGVAAIGGGYYLKVVRKKKEDFLDEEDEDDEEEETYEEDVAEDSDDDFFDDTEEEENV